MATLGNFGGIGDMKRGDDATGVAWKSRASRSQVSHGGNMIKRGKVLRDASAGPGLLAVDGQHYQFSVEKVWRAGVPPTAGMQVEVEFTDDASIVKIEQAADSQTVNGPAGTLVKDVRETRGVMISAVIARFGLPLLIATALMMVCWLFLGAVSVQTLFGKVSFTFWQILGFLNADSPWETVVSGRGGASAGFYGFLAIVTLAGPYVPYFWKDKRAGLAGVLPLAFMIAVGIMLRSNMHAAMGGTLDGALGEMQRQAQQEMMNAVSLDFGIYLALLVSLYLAAMGAKEFLRARAGETPVEASA